MILGLEPGGPGAEDDDAKFWTARFYIRYQQAGHRVDIIDNWSIIDHFAEMVDILEFVVDISLKWSIFYSKISQNGDMIYLRT